MIVARATSSHDDTDSSGMMELSKEADQLFSAIQVQCEYAIVSEKFNTKFFVGGV